MELVEDHQADALERRVFLQPTGEHAFGDHFDARGRPDLAFEANAVTDGFPDPFAQLAGHPLGRGARGQAPGLEHDDALAGQPRLVEQRERHAGSLARPGRCLEHGFVAFTQGLAQGRQYGIDR